MMRSLRAPCGQTGRVWHYRGTAGGPERTARVLTSSALAQHFLFFFGRARRLTRLVLPDAQFVKAFLQLAVGFENAAWNTTELPAVPQVCLRI